jgi:hypothetical protein
VAEAPDPRAAVVTAGADRMGPDLERLAAGLTVPARRIVTLTRLRGPAVEHASFRLELADGRILKGRRLPSAAQARLVATLLGLVDRRHFPAVIAQAGAGLIEEWRSGEPLGELDVDPGFVRRCGEVLGALHRVPRPAVAVPWRARPGIRLKLVRRQIEALERWGALTTASRLRAVALADDHAPAHHEIGVVHHDFCAENLVRDPEGRPHVIDNETLRIGVLDFDLARTWYRWPMAERTATAFLDGYAAHRSPAAYLAHFRFWALAVLVDVAHFHLKASTERASDALDALHAFLEGSPMAGRWLPSR